MRVFVTGATGVLGRPVVARLAAGGHDVRALSRSGRNEADLRAAGATPVTADLFDADSMVRAVAGCDAVLHLATRIPPSAEATKRDAWHENDRIRSLGTHILVDAALASGVRTLIYPGVTLVYADGGADWIEAGAEIEPVGILESDLDAENHLGRFTAAGGRGIVLRMGGFYAPSAPSTLDLVAAARRGLGMMVGRRESFLSQIWVDDAASAVVSALERAPTGIFDVVDNEPLTRRDVSEAVAQAVGRRRLLRPPAWLLGIAAGRDMLVIARSHRVSNRRFREATGWKPEVPDAREGWKRIAEALAEA